MFDTLLGGFQGMLGESIGPRGPNKRADVKRVEGALDMLGYLDAKKPTGLPAIMGTALSKASKSCKRTPG